MVPKKQCLMLLRITAGSTYTLSKNPGDGSPTISLMTFAYSLAILLLTLQGQKFDSLEQLQAIIPSILRISTTLETPTLNLRVPYQLRSLEQIQPVKMITTLLLPLLLLLV
jgi:hypothetical protein